MSAAAMDATLEREVELFLIHEADLLDEKRFEEWNDLFLADGIYWVPGRPEQADPYSHVSIYFDDAGGRDVRIRRLRHQKNLVEDPATRTLHVVQNVVVERKDADTVEARSRLVMFDWRADVQRIYGARVRHVLKRRDGALRISLKRVDLLNCDGVLPMLSVPF